MASNATTADDDKKKNTKKKKMAQFLSPNVLFQKVVSAPMNLIGTLASSPSASQDRDESKNNNTPSNSRPHHPAHVVGGLLKGGTRHLRNIFAIPMSFMTHIVDDATFATGRKANYELPSYKHTNDEIRFLTDNLKDHYLFESLSDKEIDRLVSAFELYELAKNEKADQALILQDEWATNDTAYFYIVYKGRCIYAVNGEIVGEPAIPGDCFGELALLYNCPRAATVRALTSVSAVKLFRIHQKGFRCILQQNNDTPDYEKLKLLDGVPFLRQNLRQEQLVTLAQGMKPKVFDKGEYIIPKGEVTKEWLVLERGQIRVTNIDVSDSNTPSTTGNYGDVVFKVGDCFGELSILQGWKSPFDVIAETEGLAFVIDKDVFKSIFGTESSLKKAVGQSSDYKKLKGIPIIAETIQGEESNHSRVLSYLVSQIDDVTFKKGDVICEEGKPIMSAAFCFVRSGKVRIHSKQNNSDYTVSAEYFFGDDQLLFDTKPNMVATYTATIMEDSTILGKLKLESCRKIMNTRKMGLPQTFLLDTLEISGGRAAITFLDLERRKILGAGTFGQVWLVSRKSSDGTQHAYALKIQSKYELVQNGQARGVVQEKQIMAKLQHPFVGRLITSFQDTYFVYMVMPLIQGGELYSVMNMNRNGNMSEDDAIFYSAAIAEGLTYMHRRGFVYRDLKPENVLVDAQGYPVIVDFGFAKYVVDKTFTLCGTPLYIAPEVILNRGHNYGADHWSLGCLVHEMLSGRTPFYENGMDQSDLFKTIVKGSFTMPSGSSHEAQSLIEGLLTRNPSRRLGSLGGGLDDVVYHPWLCHVDHDGLLLKEIKAPHLPNINDPFDGSNFDDWSHVEDKTTKSYPRLKPSQEKLFEAF